MNETEKQILELVLNDGAIANRLLINTTRKGNFNLISYLLDHGCVNKTVVLDPNGGGETLPSIAAKEGRLDIVKLFMERHPDMSHAHLALIDAAKNGHKEVVEYLLRKSVDPYKKGSRQTEKGSALDFAISNGQIEVLHTMLAYKVDLTRLDTSMHNAVLKGDLETLTFLLENGVKPDIYRKGMTPLMTLAKFAEHEKRIAMLFLLLEKNADPTLTDSEGNTAAQLVDNKSWRPHIDDGLKEFLKEAEQEYRSRGGASPARREPPSQEREHHKLPDHFRFISSARGQVQFPYL